MLIFYEPWVQIRILLDLLFLLEEVLCKYQQKNLIYHLNSCKGSNHTYLYFLIQMSMSESRFNPDALKVQSDLDHHCVSFKMLLYP